MLKKIIITNKELEKQVKLFLKSLPKGLYMYEINWREKQWIKEMKRNFHIIDENIEYFKKTLCIKMGLIK